MRPHLGTGLWGEFVEHADRLYKARWLRAFAPTLARLCKYEPMSMDGPKTIHPSKGGLLPVASAAVGGGRTCANIGRKHRSDGCSRSATYVKWSMLGGGGGEAPSSDEEGAREPAPYFVGPRCVFVCVGLCVCVLSSKCLVSRPSHLCVCRIGSPPAR